MKRAFFVLLLCLSAFAVQYTLTVSNSTPPGSITPGVGVHSYDAGTFVNISYKPPLNYVYKWVITGTAQLSQDSTQVWMNGNGVLYPYDSINLVCWKNIMHVVAGVGGTITAPVDGYDTTCVHNQSDNIVAAAAMGYRFSTWTGAGINFLHCCQATSAGTIDDSSSHTATASFTKVQYTLTMVNSSPAGAIAPTAGAHTVDTGAVTALSYVHSAGYHLANWTTDVPAVFAPDSSTIALKENTTLTAHAAATKYMIYVYGERGGTGWSAGIQDDSQSVHPIYGYSLSKPWYVWSHWTCTNSCVVFANASAETTTVTIKAAGNAVGNWIVAPAVIPTPVSPANTDTGVSKSPTFRWRKAPVDSFYLLEMDTINTFNSGARSLNYTRDTFVAKTFTGTTKQKRYWRVYGQNSSGQSLPSASRWYIEESYPSTLAGWMAAFNKTFDPKTNTQKASKQFIAAFVAWVKKNLKP